jgi:hypothetical protein
MNSKLLQLPPLRFPESEKAGIEPRTNVPYYELVSQRLCDQKTKVIKMYYCVASILHWSRAHM